MNSEAMHESTFKQKEEQSVVESPCVESLQQEGMEITKSTKQNEGDSTRGENLQAEETEYKEERVLNSFNRKIISSPVFTSSAPSHRGLSKGISSPAIILPTGLARQISKPAIVHPTGLVRQLSKAIFKPRPTSITKYGVQCRKELSQFLQHRGFTAQELDSIVVQFHDIREQLDGGEWVTREQFKVFFGVREQEFSDRLFDVFKQRHKMHNFSDLRVCPLPQAASIIPEGVETDAINLRDFLCGLLLLQSNQKDKKLRMVFDLYNSKGSVLTRDNLREMLLVSAKENKIALTEDKFDSLVERVFGKMDSTGTGKIEFEDFKRAFLITPQNPLQSDTPSSPYGVPDQVETFQIDLEKRKTVSPINDFLAVNTASPSVSAPKSWTISVDDVMTGDDDDDIGTLHPDFVERDFEDDNPRRSIRKQKKFENVEKVNYIPQQEPAPKKKPNVKRKVLARLHASGSKYAFLSLFLMINLSFFLWSFLEYGLHPRGNLGWGVPFARGFAQVLKIDTVLLLLPVARSFLTYLRASPLHQFLPLDKNISFHKFVALIICVASVGHWGAHLANFYYITKSDLSELQVLNPTFFTKVPSYLFLNFQTVPGITGSLLLIVLFAKKRVRKQSFEKFYSIHHLFIIFYAALLFHGFSHILGPYEYWKWLLAPGSIYLVERIVRVYRQRRVQILDAKILPDRAVMLKMELPQRRFPYKAGQYIFLNFPSISKFEWHPFTLTSAPHEEFLSVHIRAAGNWTNKVYKLCNEPSIPNICVDIEGPYGSASEHVFSYSHVIMIGAGIGVTPFASVLKRLRNHLETDKVTKLKKVHFFWTCREQGAFQWFADILSQLEASHSTKDVIEVNTFLTGALAQHDVRSIMLWYGLQQEYLYSNVDLVTGLSSRTYWGRPNFDRIIEHLFHIYPKKRIGVFFCGPSPMAHSINASCKKFASPNGSTFYFHKENF